MKRKRLDRDIGWGFQFFPYYQFRLECDMFHGLVSLINLNDGEYQYWDNFKKAGRIAVCGRGMKWLQLAPDRKNRLITAMFLPDGRLSAVYIDVAERIEFDPDGVAAYVDKYLDVVITPQGDVSVLDRDELDLAYHNGDMTKDQYKSALSECGNILSELGSDVIKTTEYLDSMFGLVLSRIEAGEKPMNTKYQKELKGEV